MGNQQSAFNEEELEWFEENTFFTRKEILKIHKFFLQLTSGQQSLTTEQFVNINELRINPFRHRIAEVFANEDGILLFEDFLDFLSIFSDEATRDVKSFYAFQIYDFNNDDYIDGQDMYDMVKLQVGDELSEDEIRTIVTKMVEETDIDGDGRLSYVEFEHVVARCPDFVKGQT
ncbi:calcium and integrin binding 1 [Paraphysoderma sedebokerense]|nr:calcium and integrin binding 1 [Paraphysoderma sedebokerense]